MSVAGFRSLLAVLDAGFEPAGIVMGAGAFQVVRPMCPGFSTSSEPFVYPTYEQALMNAWRNAIDRLEAEACKAGAHGVCGVTVQEPTVSTGVQSLMQLQLVGSALRVAGAPALSRPFLSMLSMEDTLALLLRGFVPVTIVVGIAAVHVHAIASSPLMRGAPLTNAEMPGPTAAMVLARARAEYAVRESLRHAKADGCVASDVAVTREAQAVTGCDGSLVAGRILGTGIVRYRSPLVELSAVRNVAARSW